MGAAVKTQVSKINRERTFLVFENFKNYVDLMAVIRKLTKNLKFKKEPKGIE